MLLDFFYRNVLHRYWYVDTLPRVRGPKIIPVILSEQEVAAMINEIHSVFYKAILMLMYSSGLRNSELRNLKTIDIDSARNLIDVRCAKGKKDRQAFLSPLALKALRTYWRLFRSSAKVDSDYLFIPTKNSHSGVLKKRLSHTALSYVLKVATKAAGIKKNYTSYV